MAARNPPVVRNRLPALAEVLRRSESHPATFVGCCLLCWQCMGRLQLYPTSLADFTAVSFRLAISFGASVLSRAGTRPPVDLYCYYLFLQREGSEDTLDFWLDVQQHENLCTLTLPPTTASAKH